MPLLLRFQIFFQKRRANKLQELISIRKQIALAITEEVSLRQKIKKCAEAEAEHPSDETRQRMSDVTEALCINAEFQKRLKIRETKLMGELRID